MSGIAIHFDSVSFSYGKHQVLENASFHIHCGEFTAMVGPNGSGKTTVLKLLFGLESPCSGSIKVSGVTSYVSQHMPSDNLFPITVRDIVRMGLLKPGKNDNAGYVRAAVSGALEKTGIANLAARQYSSLSGGEKRRALVARALVSNPQILVLDEPTANMDKESEAMLYETLGACKGTATILIVTHDTEFVTSLTDRVLCLGDGHRLVQHRTEVCQTARHGISNQEVRVLHEENIADDNCCKD
ncbi:MAG: ATP-binding cassette domain-containing protein [Treponema sp.]|nr:ATP-binding cassette domain-containing protein [Treponema sp.]